MLEVVRPLRRPPSAFAFAAVLAAFTASASPILAHAQGTHLWSQSRLEEFEKGTPQGVALSSDGHLRTAPGLKEVFTTPSTFVWSVAAGPNGVAYVGTGSPATVQRVSPDGTATTLFETHDLTVQALCVGPDGSLYAATMPSGKVYRIKPGTTTGQDESSATLVFDPARLDTPKSPASKPADEHAPSHSDSKSHYVWDLTFDKSGRLYIAAGGPGTIYRVDPAHPGSTPDTFFKSDEQHIRTLAWDPHGNLIAGTDGSGLVYRISPDGKGYVLFEAPRREITAVSVGADGAIYAASVGDKAHNPLPPLPVQGTGVITFTVVQPGSLQAANSSTSAPEGTEIYELKPDQAPRKLWAGKDEIVYALAARPDGLLALTGNRGRVFMIQEDGAYADIAHLEAQQGLALAIANPADKSSRAFIGTGNTGKLYSLGAQETHEYASDVLDAGALARFGRIEVEPGSANFQILTRSGNVEQPVRGWSDWQPLNDGAIASPPGRFLQWKAVLQPSGVLGGVGVNYLPVNAAPVLDELVVVPGARLTNQAQSNPQPQTVNINFPSANQNPTITFDSGSSTLTAQKDKSSVTARWAAHDDNGDDLTYSLFLRGDNENVWRLLKDNLTEKAYTFDATLLPDGGYQLKVVASDAPSHSPGQALTGFKESDRFEVDTTPPVVTGLKAAEQPEHTVVFTFDAEDASSPIAHAEYSIDAGPWQYIEPVGQLSDARREHYDVHIPAKALEGKPGEHLLTVRAYDRHDNAGLAKTTFTTSAAAAK